MISCSWIAPDELEDEQRELICSLCADRIDWSAFLDLVDRHQIVSSAANRLLRFCPESLPPGVKIALKQKALELWRHSVGLAKELLSVVQALPEAMPLKGPALASRLFGDPGFRDVLDLDLLVRFEDLAGADAILESRGYQRVVPAAKVTPKQLKILFEQCHHWVYIHPVLRIPLELHWRIFRWTDAETATLWQRSIRREWMGALTTQMDDATLLLSLCDHGSQHRYNRLKWLSDIAMLAAGFGESEWREVHELARTMNLELPLAQAALLVRRLYGLSPPISHDPTAERLAREALRCILDEEVDSHFPRRERAGLRHLWFWAQQTRRMAWYSTHLRENTPWVSRVKPLLIGVTDFEVFPLPDRWFWLYYPLRPVFWVARCLRGR